MGQYHITVSLDKQEFLHPHRLGDGLKLWEQGASQGGVLNALHALLAVSNGRGGGDYISHPLIGRWGGDRIAVVGDYAEANDLPGVDYAEYIFNVCVSSAEGAAELSDEERLREFGTLHPEEWKDISELAVDFLSQQWDLTFSGEGWVNRVPKAGSVFEDRSGPAMRPDMLINLTPADES